MPLLIAFFVFFMISGIIILAYPVTKMPSLVKNCDMQSFSY